TSCSSESSRGPATRVDGLPSRVPHDTNHLRPLGPPPVTFGDSQIHICSSTPLPAPLRCPLALFTQGDREPASLAFRQTLALRSPASLPPPDQARTAPRACVSVPDSSCGGGGMGSDSKELLGIEPLELQFPFELKKQISCSMQLTNSTDDYIGFKVKTTSPKKYCVRPNSGIVPPRSTSDVIVTMQAQKEAPLDLQCKDKFLVQSVIVAEGTSPKDITGDLFTKQSGNVVNEVKLKVVYVPPPKPPSPVREGSEEGSSPRPSLSDGSSLNYQETTRESDESPSLTALKAQKGQEGFTPETSALISKLTEERNSAIQQNNKLREELDLVRRELSKQNGGFSFVVVAAIALLGILLGFIMKR
ncbi:unnamed protein product, partial [Urochloa humidicola]